MLVEQCVDAAAFDQACVQVVARALHHHDELALALVVVGVNLRLQVRQRAIEDGLEQLGQLARQHRGTVVAEGVRMSASDS